MLKYPRGGLDGKLRACMMSISNKIHTRTLFFGALMPHCGAQKVAPTQKQKHLLPLKRGRGGVQTRKQA
jgi:hypothetical protein